MCVGARASPCVRAWIGLASLLSTGWHSIAKKIYYIIIGTFSRPTCKILSGYDVCVCRPRPLNNCSVKAEMLEISSNTHRLYCIPLHHFTV